MLEIAEPVAREIKATTTSQLHIVAKCVTETPNAEILLSLFPRTRKKNSRVTARNFVHGEEGLGVCFTLLSDLSTGKVQLYGWKSFERFRFSDGVFREQKSEKNG